MASRDPYFLSARRPGVCSQCHAAIARGARIFYYPVGRVVLCSADACSGTASRDFSAGLADERGY